MRLKRGDTARRGVERATAEDIEKIVNLHDRHGVEFEFIGERLGLNAHVVRDFYRQAKGIGVPRSKLVREMRG